MKVLFICRHNAGRSQFAEAIYNTLTDSGDAASAGTQVDIPGEILEERWKKGGAHAVDVMDELGINIRRKQRTPLTEEMLDNFDSIIRIVQDEYCPSWLLQRVNVLFWDIEDPKGNGIDAVRVARDKVQEKVKELIKETNSADVS